MWDESALAALGLDRPKEEPKRAPTGGSPISVELRPSPAAAAHAKPRSPVLTWAITFGVALVVGVGVYFLVRGLR